MIPVHPQSSQSPTSSPTTSEFVHAIGPEKQSAAQGRADPRCALCQTPLGPRPWPVLCLADEARPNQLTEWLAEGRLQPLTLCPSCDAALINFLHTRQNSQHSIEAL